MAKRARLLTTDAAKKNYKGNRLYTAWTLRWVYNVRIISVRRLEAFLTETHKYDVPVTVMRFDETLSSHALRAYQSSCESAEEEALQKLGMMISKYSKVLKTRFYKNRLQSIERQASLIGDLFAGSPRANSLTRFIACKVITNKKEMSDPKRRSDMLVTLRMVMNAIANDTYEDLVVDDDAPVRLVQEQTTLRTDIEQDVPAFNPFM